jgi:hypothetical protein
MPNVNSNGKFGTSMDYSQSLRFKKIRLAVTYVSNVATKEFINDKVNADYKARGFGRVLESFLNPGVPPLSISDDGGSGGGGGGFFPAT